MSIVRQVKSKKYLQITGHAFFWILLTLICSFLKLSFDDHPNIPGTFFRENLYYGMPINMLVYYGIFYCLIPGYLQQRPVLFIVLAATLLGFSAGIETLIDIIVLTGADAGFPASSAYFLLGINLLIHSVYGAASCLGRLTTDWYANIRQQRRIRAQKIETELALLKSQIHPHFLFNTLNSLYSSAYMHGDTATAEGIAKLSKLLRYMLYESVEERVSLADEVTYLRNYIDLQKMRFSDDVKVGLSIQEALENVLIAPMLLIIPVENAFKHGISKQRASTISIDLKCSGKNLLFSVENPFHRTLHENPDDAETGLGLQNLRRRLALLYPDKHQLTIHRHEEIFKVVLELAWD